METRLTLGTVFLDRHRWDSRLPSLQPSKWASMLTMIERRI